MAEFKEASKIVLITGTSKGIGRELASTLLSHGHKVIGCSRQIVEFGNTNYFHYSLDVSDSHQVKNMFHEVRQNHGYIDILINNAGIASMNHFLTTPLSTARKIMETNFFGTFQMMQQGARLMTRASGRIINFTSVAKPLDLEGESAYASSKAAIETLTRIVARELAPFGITVNAIGPTPTWTDLIKSVPKAKLDALLQRQSLKKLGEFEDILNCVEFLMSERSKFVTGQVIYLGGV